MIEIHNDILLTGKGILRDINIDGIWYYPKRISSIPFKLKIIDISTLSPDTDLDIKGDVYFHPDADLLQTGARRSDNIVCLD